MAETLPLNGLRIVVTRPRAQAAGLQRELQSLGAHTLAFPTIRILPKANLAPLDQALSQLETYDWVIFTSANGVRIFWERLTALGLASVALEGRRVAAIGPATARALRGRGVTPDFVPEEFVAEGLAEGLRGVAGLRILIPRADGARSVLPRELERHGAKVDEVAIYEAVLPPQDHTRLHELASGADVLTFTSPSTVRHFVEIVRAGGLDPLRLPGAPLVACIGPITAEAAKAAGFEPRIVAQVYTTHGLVEALRRYFSEEAGRDDD